MMAGEVEETKSIYARLLEHYREFPGEHRIAAKAAGTDTATARQAWEAGFPSIGLEPLRAVIEEEMEAARAMRAQAERKADEAALEARIKAKGDAIEARGKEAQGVRLSRENAIALGVASAHLLRAAVAASEEVKRRFTDAKGIQSISLDDLRHILSTTARITQVAGDTMRTALEMERIITGEPIAILGVRADKMTPEDILTQFQAIERSLRRAGMAQTMGAGMVPGLRPKAPGGKKVP